MTLIGRERDLALVRGHLADPGARIVTIHGPAGSGTSAVLGAAATSAAAWSVDLADAEREAPIWVTVARRLGIGLDGGEDAEARITEVVARRPIALAIDHADAESLRAGLPRLLDRCPTLAVVVASRAPLGLPEERHVRLQPLPVPLPGADLETVAESPSVRLFVQRAQEVDAHFHLDPGTADDVARVCRLVGGLPLAIELAAARVRLLPPAELAARLAADGSDPDLLTSGLGDGTGRRLSLRDALDSTTAALTGGQRALLVCAAGFEGTFPVDALVSLDGRPLGEVLDDLGALVDSRLVEPIAVGEQEPAFDLLPIVRTYVRGAEWADSGRAGDLRRAYVCRTADAAARAAADCRPSIDIERIRVLRRDVVSVLDDLAADPVTAARLAVDAAGVLEGLPERAAVGAVLGRVIATGAVDGLEPALAARVWLWSAALMAETPDAQGSAAEIGARWQRSRDLADELGDSLLVLLCHSVAVAIHPATGDVARFVSSIQQGRALAASIGHAAWLARFEVWSAVLMQTSGRLDDAIDLALTALRRATRVADAKAVAAATVLLRTARPEPADHPLAVPSLESALELGRTSGDAYIESMILAALAGRELDAGRIPEAAHWCRLRLEDTARRGWTSAAGLSVVHAALIAARSGDAAFAARLLGAVAADEERIVRLLPPRRREAYEALAPQLRARLGCERYAALVAAGSVESAAGGAALALAWLQRDVPSPASPQASSGSLTPRELEVLALLANGLTNREIADELLLSVKTVMHHSVAIYRKLDVRGRAEATAYAHRHGLVTAR